MVKVRIAVLQLNPRIGSVAANIEKANRILSVCGYNINKKNAKIQQPPARGLDILVLPELAFTGYNFKSPAEIKPYLEPTASGISTQWAQMVSKSIGCHVLVGYPERFTPNSDDMNENTSNDDNYITYNSAVMVSPTGSVLFNYRKSFLYDTDLVWGCSESPDMVDGPSSKKVFPLTGEIQVPNRSPVKKKEDPDYIPLKVQVGICMDLNPDKFKTSFTDYEFANAALRNQASIILCPMAWLHEKSPDTNVKKEDYETESEYKEAIEKAIQDWRQTVEEDPKAPNWSNVNYWIQRMEPMFTQQSDYVNKKRVLYATCNRTGIEDTTAYAGSSSIYSFTGITSDNAPFSKKVNYYGSLGQNQEAMMAYEIDVDP